MAFKKTAAVDLPLSNDNDLAAMMYIPQDKQHLADASDSDDERTKSQVPRLADEEILQTFSLLPCFDDDDDN